MHHRITIVAALVVALVFAALPAVAAPPDKGGKGGGGGGGSASGPDDSDLPGPRWPIDGAEPSESDNAVLKWDDELLQTIRANPGGTGPTVASRALGVLHTAIFDAWTSYDATAVGVHSRATKRPVAERTPENKVLAVSHAAYTVLSDMFSYREADYAAQLAEFGTSVDDTRTAAQVGRDAAAAVITYRHADGSNQTGGYADTTGYQPHNTWGNVKDPWRWQPLCVPLPEPGEPCPPGHEQKPLAPHWGTIDTFAVGDVYDLWEPPGPVDREGETAQILTDSANLSDVEKVKAEYWADGPHSEFPPGHWAMFAEAVSRKRGHTLDQDVKLFFALGNAIMDAGIAAWDVKYRWDFVRPVTAIRQQYAEQTVTSWLGPYKGYGKVPGSEWVPYQDPALVVSPPFPEYVSGHSTFSTAAGNVLVSFTGSDVFRGRTTIPAGGSLFEGADGAPPGAKPVPAKPVTLSWNTFSAAAEEAGMSRRYGGIHFESGDEHGRVLGRLIGYTVYNKAQTYVDGTGALVTH